MAWVTLTTDDVEAAMSDALASEYATYVASHDDPLPGLLARMIAIFRSAIQSWPANVMGPDGTLPLSCQRQAVTMTLFDLYLLLPVEADTDFRTAYEKAEITLRGLPIGHPAVESPEDDGGASGGPRPATRPRPTPRRSTDETP